MPVPAGPIAEGDRVRRDRVGVALLAGGVGADGLALHAAHDVLAEDLGGSQVLAHHVDRALDLAHVEVLAALEQQDAARRTASPRASHRGPTMRISLPATAIVHDREGPLDEPEQLVALAEQLAEQVAGSRRRRDRLVGELLGHAGVRRAHPGGQPIVRPPSTWRCRCGTDMFASLPTFMTSR